MKKLYSTIMMLAMMVAALSFTACGDDDDEEVGNASSFLIGTWQTKYTEGYGYEFNDDDGLEYIQFKSNGTYIMVIDDEDGVYISKGKWKYSDNEIILTETEGDLKGSTFSYTIVEKGTNQMTIAMLGCTGYLEKVSDNVLNKYLK